jgi:hypothetical protein
VRDVLPAAIGLAIACLVLWATTGTVSPWGPAFGALTFASFKITERVMYERRSRQIEKLRRMLS